MQRPFSRLAIVNRGEPAMRVIHAVRELNEQRSEPIKLIALFTESDRNAMFVREADEALCLGPSLVDDGQGGRRSGYLDHGALERALTASKADAAWVGWGFVAEQPEFVDLCDRLGIVFVGPDAAVMRLVGDKIGAKRLAEEAGVPVAPWSGGPVETAEEALGHAERIGYPLMIKATAGGGGRGIRRVDDKAALAAAFTSARTEALQAFGDGTLLLEKVISPARHVEVQVIADGQGTAWAVGVRDCSYQRRNQKVIEESASTALTAEQHRELMAAAQRLALRAGYRNAGTVEFLYKPAEQLFSFMEVNARLQVEHPVTEAVTGLDLVKMQLHVAAGGRLEGEPPGTVGHAIEARLNAEDPALGFAPSPGRLALLRLPTGPGIRVDTGVAEGDVIASEFDSMIGKLIAWGSDRDEALARLRQAIARHSRRRRRRDDQPGVLAGPARPSGGAQRRRRYRVAGSTVRQRRGSAGAPRRDRAVAGGDRAGGRRPRRRPGAVLRVRSKRAATGLGGPRADLRAASPRTVLSTGGGENRTRRVSRQC